MNGEVHTHQRRELHDLAVQCCTAQLLNGVPALRQRLVLANPAGAHTSERRCSEETLWSHQMLGTWGVPALRQGLELARAAARHRTPPGGRCDPTAASVTYDVMRLQYLATYFTPRQP